jgi:hypothetical protein
MNQETRFVFESFKEFLSNLDNLNEAETKASAIMDVDSSKELVDEMIDYNSDLGASALERQSEKLPNTKTGELKKLTAEALRRKDYWIAAACSMFLKNSEGGLTKDSKVLTQLGLNPKELQKLDHKKRMSAFIEAIKGKDNESLKKSVIDDLKQNPELLGTQLKYSIIWQLVPNEDKTKVYEDFERMARSKGYEDVDSVREQIQKHYKKQKNDERSYLINPAIIIGLTKDELEKSAPPLKVRQEMAQMLPVEKQHETFKPNKWGASENPADDYVGDNFEKIKENIGNILEERKLGRVTKIKGITVQTSCDRRRNTGEAENLSWGQLALARALSMASLVYEMSKKVGLQPEEIETIQKMIRLDFMGTNGDGSSGPNSDVNPGYYVKSGKISKWVQVKDASEIVIIPASEQNGEPTKTSGDGAEIKKEAPIAASESEKFNPYRYNNIVFDVEVIEPGEITGAEIPSVQNIKGVKYPIELRLPQRFTSKSASIRIPSFKIGKASGSPGKRPSIACPSFGGKTKSSLNLGFEWKEVKVANWQSDITKQ